jgi:outer membrane protein OmpA-like peptidoglycan-associated protein
LEPVVPGSNPNIPAGGVPLGGSVFLVNGEPAAVTVAPDAPSAARATGLNVEGPGFTMRLVGRTANDRPLGVTPDGALILEQDRTAFTEGTGFQPNSEVNLYVFSEARFLGTVNTDASGAFRGSVPLPLDIPAGRHTLQSNGLAPDGAVRSLSLGVQVEALQAPTQTKKRTAKATVLFNALSAKLTPAAKKELRAVAKGRAGSAIRTLVVGYVQANDTTANDETLSTQRARSVARYLRSIGVKGAIVTRGQGVAKEQGAAARKAVVTLTYRK